MDESSRGEGDRLAPRNWDSEEYTWNSRQLVATRLDGIAGAGSAKDSHQEDTFGDPMQGAGLAEPQSASSETCMVKDCPVYLSKCKAYYRRFRICERHLKTLSLCIEGKPSRFCQQCGRFHGLEEFEGSKRSCRRALLTRFYKRRNVPVPLDVMPVAADNGPRQASKDTDLKIKPKARTPTSGETNPVRRKRGRPRAPPIDVRDLSPDDPRAASSGQQQAQQQGEQQVKMDYEQDDNRSSRGGLAPDADCAGAGLRVAPGSLSSDTLSAGSRSGSGRGGAGSTAHQQRNLVIRAADPLEAQSNFNINVALGHSASLHQAHVQEVAAPRLVGGVLHAPREHQQQLEQQFQQQQQQEEQEEQEQQQLRQALLQQLQQAQELEQRQARMVGDAHPQSLIAARCMDSANENLSRRQRHVMLLRQSSDGAANAAAAMMGLTAGPAGGAAAGDGADVVISEAWQRGPSWTQGNGDGSASAGGGNAGMGRLGPMPVNTVDPLDLELLSIASESLMTDQDMPHHNGLQGGAGFVLGLPHNQQVQLQQRQHHHHHQQQQHHHHHYQQQQQQQQQRRYQAPQINLNQSQHHQSAVLRLDADPVGISGGGYLSGGLGTRGSNGAPMQSPTVTAATLRGLQSRNGGTGGGEAVNWGRTGGRNPMMIFPGSAHAASGGLLGGHSVGAGSNSGSGSDVGGALARASSGSPGTGLADPVGMAIAEGSGAGSLMESFNPDFSINSNATAGGPVVGGLGLRLSAQPQPGVMTLGRTQQGLGAGGGGGVSIRGMLGGMGASSMRTLDLGGADSLLPYQPPRPPPQYRLHQPHQHRSQHHVLHLHQAQAGSSNITPTLKEAAQALLAQGGPRAFYTAPGSVLERLNLKIYQRRPDELSPNLAEHLADLLTNADASVLQGSIRPGCTNLALDVLYKDYERLAAGLLGLDGSDPHAIAGRFVRAVLGQEELGPDVRLHVQFRDMLLVVDGGQVRLLRRSPTASQPFGRPPLTPQGSGSAPFDSWVIHEILGVAPLAVVAGCGFTLELLGRGLQRSGTTFHVRFRGGHLDVMPELPESRNDSSGGSAAAAATTTASAPADSLHSFIHTAIRAWYEGSRRHHHHHHHVPASNIAPVPPRGYGNPQDGRRWLSPHVVALSAHSRAPMSLCSIASTASASSTADSSAVATTTDTPQQGSNHEGNLLGSATSTVFSAEERVTLEAMVVPFETEPFCKPHEKVRSHLAQAVAPGFATQYPHGDVAPGPFPGCPEDRPPRILAGWVPTGTMNSGSGYGVCIDSDEAPTCKSEAKGEWGSSEGLEGTPSIALEAGACLGPVPSGSRCGVALSTRPDPAHPAACSNGSSGGGGGSRSEGELPRVTGSTACREVGSGITNGGLGRIWMGCDAGHSNARAAVPAVLEVSLTRPSREGLTALGGSSDLRGPLGRAWASTTDGTIPVVRDWGSSPLEAPGCVGSGGLTDHTASGGVSGGNGLSTETCISDIYDGEGTDRPSCCSHSSEISVFSLESEVVVLFVEPAPRAGLALVEAESPPLPRSQSSQSQVMAAAAAAPAVVQDGAECRRSSGGGGSVGGAAAAGLTAGVLTKWWPLVVVPAGAEAAATELNALIEECGQTWLRDFVVDLGLVLEALDSTTDSAPGVVGVMNKKGTANEQSAARLHSQDRTLPGTTGTHHLGITAVDGGDERGDEDDGVMGMTLQALSPVTPHGDAIATSPSASSGTWGSGAESLARCIHGSLNSDGPTGTASTGLGALQVVAAEAETRSNAGAAAGTTALTRAQERLLEGLSESLVQAAAAPAMAAIRAGGSLRAAAAAVAIAEAAPLAGEAAQQAGSPGRRCEPSSASHRRQLESCSTGALPSTNQTGDFVNACASEMMMQHGTHLSASEVVLEPLSDPGPPRRRLLGSGLEEGAMAYSYMFTGGVPPGAHTALEQPITTRATAAGAAAAEETRSSQRLMEGCISDAAVPQGPAEQAGSSISPLLPALRDVTATEAAHFFGFSASAEVTCEQSLVSDASDVSSDCMGVGSSTVLPAMAATVACPGTAGDGNGQQPAARRATEAAMAMPQQQQRQEAGLGQSVDSGARLDGRCSEGSAAAAAAAAAAFHAAAERREQIAQQWQSQHQGELLARAKSLLVFFCNRGFHHCTRLVLTFLLRNVGVTPALADIITYSPDEGVAAFGAKNSTHHFVAQMGRLPLVFGMLMQQIHSETGLGLLHHAVRSGSAETVELVLRFSRRVGAPLNLLEPGLDGVTPAHLASLLPAAIMEALLEHNTLIGTERMYGTAAVAAFTSQPTSFAGEGAVSNQAAVTVDTNQAAVTADSTTSAGPAAPQVCRDAAGGSPSGRRDGIRPPATTGAALASARDACTAAMRCTELEGMVIYRETAGKPMERERWASDVISSGASPAGVPVSPGNLGGLLTDDDRDKVAAVAGFEGDTSTGGCRSHSSSHGTFEEELVSVQSGIESPLGSSEVPQLCWIPMMTVSSLLTSPLTSTLSLSLPQPARLGTTRTGCHQRNAVAVGVAIAAGAATFLPSSATSKILLLAAIVLCCLAVLSLGLADGGTAVEQDAARDAREGPGDGDGDGPSATAVHVMAERLQQ